MLPFFRWQWMWQSRRRVIAVALAEIALGAGCLLFALLTPGPFSRARALVLFGGLMIGGLGGYQLLQGLLSPDGAFRDHDFDDSREGRRRAWRRQRTAKPSDDRPLPLAPDTGEATRVISVRCPACHEPLAVEGAGAVECPKCHERFTPE